MFNFSLTQWLMLILGIIIGAYIGFYVGAQYGETLGEAKQENKTYKYIIVKGKEDEKNKHRLNSLDNDELKRAYCHWVLDTPYNECIKTNIYVD